MIYRLFYTSRCTLRDPFLANQEAELIVSKASVKNRGVNITGAMTFDGNDFAQILEGEKSHVLALFEIIKTDTRHEKVTLIKTKETKNRHYTNWGMRSLSSANYDELVGVMAE